MHLLCGIFLIYPKCLHALMHGILPHVRPRFQVSQHSEMLSHSRYADLLFKVDNISAYVAFMLKGFGNEGFTLPGVLRASKVLEHSFV